ncbi:hypothetical protein ScalyP_jg3278 [Parmales sp. scaly parma]|nr:hypothetical protein ScalyP_jg3278 [Parmales sp. scaly parma]
MELERRSSEEENDAVSWGDVATGCCKHTQAEWLNVALHSFFILFFLYFFLFSLQLLGTGAKIVGGCTAGALMGDIENPVAGLCIGILATVLLQSSSTTTSIVVGLVPTVIDVKLAIFVIMGANIGTSVTNTIVSMGHLGDGDELERAFAGATVHDMFNFLSVAVLLPLEVATGLLFTLTEAMTPDEVADDEKWTGPVKAIVAPLTNKVLIASKMIKKVADGSRTCDDYYPTTCTVDTGGEFGNETVPTDVVNYDNCHTGLIACDKKSGECPMFFQNNATQSQEEASGLVVLIISVLFLCICLIGLVKTLSSLLSGASAKVITKATDVHGVVAMALGAAVTILVQSSSITTSVLTPLVGLNIIPLEQMFPLTLGANIGTTVTGLLASMVSDSPKSLQVALAHLMFNIVGILIWYPIPAMRKIPLNMARWLGKCTRKSRYFPLIYLVIVFVIFPVLLLGLSSLLADEAKGYNALGWVLMVMLVGLGGKLFYYLNYQGGKENIYGSLQRRALLVDTYNSMPEELESLKQAVAVLNKKTGITETDMVVGARLGGTDTQI